MLFSSIHTCTVISIWDPVFLLLLLLLAHLADENLQHSTQFSAS